MKSSFRVTEYNKNEIFRFYGNDDNCGKHLKLLLNMLIRFKNSDGMSAKTKDF